jgi:hypothetical protein
MTKVNVTFSEIDLKRQTVHGAVLYPNAVAKRKYVIDDENIREAAYNFLQLDLTKVIDTNHNRIPNGSKVVESYIVKSDDDIYPKGTWVLGVKITDPIIWQKIVKGDLTGFSIEFTANASVQEYEIIYNNLIVGETKDHDGHTHAFVMEIDDTGKVIKGYTSEDNGHSHLINYTSETEKELEHSHRIAIV